MKLTKDDCQTLSDEAVEYLAPMACMSEVREEHCRRLREEQRDKAKAEMFPRHFCPDCKTELLYNLLCPVCDNDASRYME